MDASGESLVTVFEAENRVEFETARILLQGAGIECFVVGEETQDLFGLGRLLAGPARIQVRAEDEAEAMMVLEEMEQDVPQALEDEESPEREV